jgi:type II secretory pathway component PulC
MTRNKVYLLLFVGLLMGVVIYNIQSFSKRKPVIKAPAIQEQKEEFEFETLKRKSLVEGWGRNPFFRAEEKVLPPAKVETKAMPSQPPSPPQLEGRPPLKLEMIFGGNAQKAAILGGQFVMEGDKVGEEVVVRIESDRVILKKDGKRRTIKLDPFSSPFQVEERRP